MIFVKGINTTRCDFGSWTGITPVCEEIYCDFPGKIKAEHRWIEMVATSVDVSYSNPDPVAFTWRNPDLPIVKIDRDQPVYEEIYCDFPGKIKAEHRLLIFQVK